MTALLLAIDTTTDALSVAIGDADETRFAAFQRRRRGHAEVLVPLIQRGLQAADVAPDKLAGIAVTVGPGTFTGVRIGLAAARGLRLAAGCPVIGVGTLELLAFQASRRWPDRPILAALDARRDQVYAQLFDRAEAPWPQCRTAPAAMSAEQAAKMVPDGSVLVGSGAALIAKHADASGCRDVDLLPDAAALLDLVGARNLPSAVAPPPSPIYLRAPDAVPARPAAEPMIDCQRLSDPVHAPSLLAELHAACFSPGWSAKDCADLLAMPGAALWVATQAGMPVGFLLLNRTGPEAEILAIGVLADQRRTGVARSLIRHAVRDWGEPVDLFLEVRRDNHAARALYRGLGFLSVGERRSYYADGTDALVLRLDGGVSLPDPNATAIQPEHDDRTAIDDD